MKKLFDLRFVIGMFFAVVGLLLIIYHFAVNVKAVKYHTINIWSGILYLLFGIVMIVLSFKNKLPENS